MPSLQLRSKNVDVPRLRTLRVLKIFSCHSQRKSLWISPQTNSGDSVGASNFTCHATPRLIIPYHEFSPSNSCTDYFSSSSLHCISACAESNSLIFGPVSDYSVLLSSLLDLPCRSFAPYAFDTDRLHCLVGNMATPGSGCTGTRARPLQW